MRRTSTLVAVVAAAALALGGCTVSGADEPGPSGDAAPATSGPTEEQEPTEDESPVGPSPEELSEQVLEVASAPVGEPIAGQTVTIDEAPNPGTSAEVTVDILSVERTADATLVRLQLSSPTPGVQLGRQVFNDVGSANLEFFNRFALEDTTNGTRYLPLSWRRAATNDLEPADAPLNSCICPYRGNNLTLGPEPIVMDSLYGPLPDGVTAVTFTAPGGVAIPDVPVTSSGG